MQVQAHFTFHTQEEYIEFSRIIAGMPVPKQQPKDVGLEKDYVAPKPTKVPSTNEKLAAKAAKEAAPTEEIAPSADEPVEPTFDNVKTKILAVAKKTKSKDAAVGILQKYGAATVIALDEKHYEAVIEACDDLLAA